MNKFLARSKVGCALEPGQTFPKKSKQEDEFEVSKRALNLFSGLLYAYIFRYVYSSYISVEWGYTGLIYDELERFQLFFIYGAIACVSWFVPIRIDRPSSVIIWFLYVIVYVPTMAITMMIGYQSADNYVIDLTALSVGMILICRIVSSQVGTESLSPITPGTALSQMLLATFVMSSLLIFFYYREILNFSGIEYVYVQRFVAADMTGGVMGYIRSYYGSFLLPLMIAAGICSKQRRGFVVLGTMGFFLSYMVDASKISLVIPAIMIIFGIAFSYRVWRFYHLTNGMIIVCVISAALTEYTRLVRFIADLVLLRTISIPAQTFAQYSDVFGARGYTWWSNITGLNMFLSAPDAFKNDPLWPVLGEIVGAEYYGYLNRVNLNANPFVGEGVAAGGWIGIIAISFALSIFLYVIDKFSSFWDRRFALVLMAPIGLTLTNVHLSTYLVSFGGLAWLLLFRFYRPAR